MEGVFAGVGGGGYESFGTQLRCNLMRNSTWKKNAARGNKETRQEEERSSEEKPGTGMLRGGGGMENGGGGGT